MPYQNVRRLNLCGTALSGSHDLELQKDLREKSPEFKVQTLSSSGEEG